VSVKSSFLFLCGFQYSIVEMIFLTYPQMIDLGPEKSGSLRVVLGKRA